MKNKPTTRVTLEELFETLNFYAEEDNYLKKNWAIERGNKMHWSGIAADNGEKARKILKKFLKDGFFYAKI